MQVGGVGGVLQQLTAQFSFNLAFVIHQLPLWFLVFALFLPRIAMLVAWFQGMLVPFHLRGHCSAAACWLILPRVLVLYLIYVDQGLSLWFLIHLVVALAGLGWRRAPDAAQASQVWAGPADYSSVRAGSR